MVQHIEEWVQRGRAVRIYPVLAPKTYLGMW